MKFTRYIAFTALVLSLVLGFVQPAKAYTITSQGVENKDDFVLEPGKMELFVNPGETLTRNVMVTSRINKRSNFLVQIEDFIGSKEEQMPVVLLGDQKSPYTFKDNILPEVDSFNLDFGQRITLPISITVPKDARPGGYYTSVIIANQPDEASDDSGAGRTRVISRVGVLLFIRVNGPVVEKGQLDDFRLKEGKRQLGVLQSGPLSFEILFNNTGTVHLVPHGEVKIKNAFGQEVAKLPVDAYFAMPNAFRYRQVTWEKQILAGRYTAELSLTKGYGDEVDVKTISFWVLPWKYIGGIILFAILITLAYYFFSRKFELRRKE
ncbi:MAG: hypothetical protein RL094_224 [Candidatus Parcubacteria bacterium]|jgi:hypothetical protein